MFVSFLYLKMLSNDHCGGLSQGSSLERFIATIMAYPFENLNRKSEVYTMNLHALKAPRVNSTRTT